jgi:peptidoglycan hydrolase-like protein with peptidoglycan-binding domain
VSNTAEFVESPEGPVNIYPARRKIRIGAASTGSVDKRGANFYMAECAHMLDDGDCRVAVDTRPLNNQLAPVRPEGDIVITKPVGVGGTNVYDDVFNIQYGLDQVAPIDGGPSPQLVIDGKCGPKTIGAIREFQKKHFGWAGCDGRIDPGKQTLAKLNEKRNRNVFPTIPLNLKTDGFLLAGMLQHVPHTRTCVNAAIANITLALTVADSNIPGLLGASRESRMKLLNRHFRIDNFKTRTQPLQKLRSIYSLMLNVLDRPEAFITLDTDNSGENISTVAFARLGGFHDKNDLTGKIVLRRGVLVATGIPDFAAFIFIHELRHYVDQDGRNGHSGKGWVTDPGMQKLKETETIFNCDTFAGFALEARNGEMQRPGYIRSSVFR